MENFHFYDTKTLLVSKFIKYGFLILIIGTVPRNFNFSECGKFLVVGNQTSDNLVVFSFDGERSDTEFLAQIPIKRPNRVLMKKL